MRPSGKHIVTNDSVTLKGRFWVDHEVFHSHASFLQATQLIQSCQCLWSKRLRLNKFDPAAPLGPIWHTLHITNVHVLSKAHKVQMRTEVSAVGTFKRSCCVNKSEIEIRFSAICWWRLSTCLQDDEVKK